MSELSARTVVRLVQPRGGDPEAYLGDTRGWKATAWVRQQAMYLHFHLSGACYSKTGRAFRRDRSTVRHAVRKVQREMEAQPPLKNFLGRTLELWGAAGTPQA